MGLTSPQAPERAIEIVRAAIGSLIDHPESPAYALADGGTENVYAAAPHKIFFVGLEDVAEGRVLSAARHVGWRYVILKSEDPMAVAELRVEEGGEGLEFSQLNRGPYVGGTVEGVVAAQALVADSEEDYEPRLLKIPGLYVVGLWLHGQSEGREIIIPLPPTRPELRALEAYSEDDFSGALRGAAVKRLEFEDDEPIPA